MISENTETRSPDPVAATKPEPGLHELVIIDDLQEYAGVSRETLWRWCMRGVAGASDRVVLRHSRGRGGRLMSTKHNVDQFRSEWAEARRSQYSMQHRKGQQSTADAYLTQFGM